ncbi:hypothetical protein ACFL17_00500 [Pseudomonadota bacterium]
MNKSKISGTIRNFLLIILIFIGAYAGLKTYVSYQTMKTVERVVSDAKPVVDIHYGEVLSSFDGKISLKDVSLEIVETGDMVHVQSVIINNGNLLELYKFTKAFSSGKRPRYLNLSILGFSVGLNSRLVESYRDALNYSHPPFPEKEKLLNCGDIFKFDAELLTVLGYAGSKIDFSVVVDLRSSNAMLELGIQYPDLTMITIKSSFEPEGIYAVAIPSADSIKLKDFEMVLNPGRFLEESMEYCMKKENATKEQVNRAFLLQFEQRMTELNIQPDSDMLKEYRKFLNTPSQLVVTASPPKPVDLETLRKYDPVDVPGLLNMGFTVE